MTIDFAVVPVAGLGTRLLPLTKSQPKEMLPIGRKPVVQYVVEELGGCGMNRILFVTGPGKTAIENHFDLNYELTTYLRETGREELLAELAFERRTGLSYFYTRQRRQLGLGHAVACAEPLVGQQPFVVALGDSIVTAPAVPTIVPRLVAAFEARRADAVVALEEVPAQRVSRYGIVAPAQEGDEVLPLAGIVEKPQPDQAPSRWAVAARYVLSPVVFDYLRRIEPGIGGVYQLTDALSLMLADGRKIYGVPLRSDEKRFDVDYFGDYFRAMVHFALNDRDYGAELRAYARELLTSDDSDP